MKIKMLLTMVACIFLGTGCEKISEMNKYGDAEVTASIIFLIIILGIFLSPLGKNKKK